VLVVPAVATSIVGEWSVVIMIIGILAVMLLHIGPQTATVHWCLLWLRVSWVSGGSLQFGYQGTGIHQPLNPEHGVGFVPCVGACCYGCNRAGGACCGNFYRR
jgi:hypothetical protein